MKNKLINKVLMCEPRYFSVDYVINPWMTPGSVDVNKAIMQWNKLSGTLQELGVEVVVLPGERKKPDMVFACDQAVVCDKKIILSNFKYAVRRVEQKNYKKWYEKNEFKIENINRNFFLEGGDVAKFGDILLVGTGFRSSKGTALLLNRLTGLRSIELELVDPRFYHLDTCLFVLNQDVVFYYPPAFSAKSNKLLNKIIPKLITFTQSESLSFVANNVVTDHHVLTHIGNPIFKSQIKSLGYAPVSVDVSEFIKSGGGIHCLVQIVDETYEKN